MTYDPYRLPDDLEAIASAIPPASPAAAALREQLALLPNPLSPSIAGSSAAFAPDVPQTAADALVASSPLGSVQGSSLAAGSVPGEAIRASAITADKISAGAITADKLMIGDRDPTITNPGFETGDFTGWNTYPASGGQIYTENAGSNAHSGVWTAVLYNAGTTQSRIASEGYVAPAHPAEAWTLSCWCRGEGGSGNVVVLQLHCYDGNKAYLGTVTSGEFPVGQSTWTHHIARLTTLSGTCYVALGVVNQVANRYLVVDDCQMQRGSTLIDASGITIYDGKLTFVDNNGYTALDGGGFGDTWADFIHHGLRNAAFAAGSAHWGLNIGSGHSLYVEASAEAPSGYLITFVSPGNGSYSYLVADNVPILGGAWYDLVWYGRVVWGTVGLMPTIRFLDKNFQQVGSDVGNYSNRTNTAIGYAVSGPFQAPSTARYAMCFLSLSAGASAALYTMQVSLKIYRTTREVIPPGVIVLWSGAANAVPDGWLLCDGTNGTPDLTDRFVVGLASGSPFSGGAVSPTASHHHPMGDVGGSSAAYTGTLGGSQQHIYNAADGQLDVTPSHSHSMAHTHSGSGNTGEGGTLKHYALAYIMKT